MSKTVAAVVVTYNRKDLLLENIEALLHQTASGGLSVVIIDNNSTDGTVEALESYIARGDIHYHNTGANLGGAGGFQYGIDYAAQLGFDFIWIMDDDCIPHPDALEAFLKWDETLGGNYGFLNSKVLWTDGSLCKMNIPRRTLTHKTQAFEGEPTPLFFASFVSLFVPTRVIRDIGLPIKEFFIWTDDWEYSRRISRKYPCYYVPDSVVTHKCKTNIGVNIATDLPERLERYYYLYRNEFYLYRREGVRGIAYDIIRKIGHILRIIRKSPDHRLARIKYIFVGTAAGFRFHPPIRYVPMNPVPGKGADE